MNAIQSTLKLYATCARRAFLACTRNWKAMFAPLLYSLILYAAIWLAAPMGMLAGIVLQLASAACSSSYLRVIDESARAGGRVTWEDVKSGFGTYFNEIIGILFLFWIASLFLTPLARSLPGGGALVFALTLAAGVVFNPIPELIYQSPHRSVDLLRACVEFIQENWIEWLIPNIVLAIVLQLLDPAMPFQLSSPLTLFAQLHPFSLLQNVKSLPLLLLSPNPLQLVLAVVGLFGMYFLMVFRGFLFRELNGSSRRSRMFRQRFYD